MGRWSLFLGVLALALALAAWAVQPPGGLDHGQPGPGFSTPTAMAQVQAIAARAHPSGSREIVRVRGHLVSSLKSLGLPAEVHTGVGLAAGARWDPRFVQAGSVQNVVAVLRGREPNLPAVLVMSHYDTVANSPGAADDSTGVAVALEIARALKAAGPHRRDVVFLVTDGEEDGLLGAEAFFTADPLARHAGVVLNMDARGDRGRALMFETGPNSGGLVRLFGERARGPSANSLMAYVYRRMPNGTDFTHARNHGLPGLNFAFLGDQLAYHTPLSTPAHLDPATLRHLGGEVLPVAQALADAPALPPAGPELTYSDVLGQGLVVYPAPMGWLLWGVAAALLGLATWRAGALGGLTAADLGRGVLGWLLLGSGVALALHTAAGLLPTGGASALYARLAAYRWLLAGAALLALGVSLVTLGELRRRGARRWAVLAAAALGLLANLDGFDPIATGLAVATALLALGALGRATSTWGLWCGALAAAVAAGLAAQALAPPVAFVIVWPLLAGTAAAAVTLFWRTDLERWPPRLMIALIAVPVAAEFAAFASLLFDALGPPTPAVLALPALLLVLVLIPLAPDTTGLRLSGWAAAGGGALLFALAGHGAGMGANHPRLTQALYLANPSAGLYQRVAPQARLDDWSRAVLSADRARPARGQVSPLYAGPVWVATAKRAPQLVAPEVSVARTPLGAQSQLSLHARSRGGGEALALWLRPSVGLRETALNGRTLAVDLPAGRWSELIYYAPGPQPLTLDLLGPGKGAVEVRAVEYIQGWPAASPAPPAKPAGLMGWGWSDYTAVVGAAHAAW